MRKFSEIFADAKLKADLEGALHGEDDTDHQKGSKDHPYEQFAWQEEEIGKLSLMNTDDDDDDDDDDT